MTAHYCLFIFCIGILSSCTQVQNSDKQKDQLIAQQQHQLSEMETRLKQLEEKESVVEKVDSSIENQNYNKPKGVNSIGDGQLDVLMINGIPDNDTKEDVWRYGASTISFNKSGNIISFHNAGNLKVKGRSSSDNSTNTSHTQYESKSIETKPMRKSTYVYFVAQEEVLPGFGETGLSKTKYYKTKVFTVNTPEKIKSLERCIDEVVMWQHGMYIPLRALTFDSYDDAYSTWKYADGSLIDALCQ